MKTRVETICLTSHSKSADQNLEKKSTCCDGVFVSHCELFLDSYILFFDECHRMRFIPDSFASHYLLYLISSSNHTSISEMAISVRLPNFVIVVLSTGERLIQWVRRPSFSLFASPIHVFSEILHSDVLRTMSSGQPKNGEPTLASCCLYWAAIDSGGSSTLGWRVLPLLDFIILFNHIEAIGNWHSCNSTKALRNFNRASNLCTWPYAFHGHQFDIAHSLTFPSTRSDCWKQVY